MPFELEIHKSFHKMINVFVFFCQPLCKKYNINQTCLNILIFLSQHPDYNTAKDFCAIFSEKTGKTSVSIELLIKQDLLIRQDDKNDRRIKRLILTEKAKSIIEEGEKVKNDFINILCKGISQEELKTYYDINKKILDNLEDISKEMLRNND